MAEENAYLQYNDGFVLHNGLPVKWIANSADLYNDYDLIIEQTNPNYAYEGFTIPITYTTSGNAWFNQGSVARAAISGASAGWGLSTAMIDGDVKIKSYNKPAQVVHKTGTPTTVTSTSPKIPTEYSGTKTRAYSDVYGVVYPKNQNHFFIGVKFANNYGVPSMPDLTNHGNAGGTSVIHKIRAPRAGSFLGMINASNYTAVKNVYAPNLSNTAMGLNHLDEEYGTPSVKTRLFENWYIPAATFLTQNAAQTNTAWSANVFVSDTSAKGITAAEVIMNNLKQFEDINANFITGVGDAGYTTAKDVSAAYDLSLNGFKNIDNITAGRNLTLNAISSDVNNITVIGSANFNQVKSVSGLSAASAKLEYIPEVNDVKISKNLSLRNVTAVNNVEASGVLSANYVNMSLNHVSGYGKCYVGCVSSSNLNDVYFNEFIHPSYSGSFQLDGNELKDVTINSALYTTGAGTIAGTIFANKIENVNIGISSFNNATLSAKASYINGLHITASGSGPILRLSGSSAFDITTNRSIVIHPSAGQFDIVSGMSATQIQNLSANNIYDIKANNFAGHANYTASGIRAATVGIGATTVRDITFDGTKTSGSITINASDVSGISAKTVSLHSPQTVNDVKTSALEVISAVNPSFNSTVEYDKISCSRCSLTNKNLENVSALVYCTLNNVSASGVGKIEFTYESLSSNNILLDDHTGYDINGWGGWTISGLKLKLYPGTIIRPDSNYMYDIAFTALCENADIYAFLLRNMSSWGAAGVSATYSGTMTLSSNNIPLPTSYWMPFWNDCVMDYRNVELIGTGYNHTFTAIGSAHYILPNRWKTNNQISAVYAVSGATYEWVD
jgi:hypothetical protein